MKTSIKSRLTKLSVVTALFFGLTANAQDKKITPSQLPAPAQSFIKQHFKGETVTSAVLDKEMFDNDYETVLSNGVKIDFDAKGNWDSIESRNALPASVVPKAIATYLAASYKGQNVVQIDKKIAGYDIELSNGTELEFDANGKFLRIDD